MPRYTPWTWSPPHDRHYMYLLSDDGLNILETLWSGPAGGPGPTAASAAPGPATATPQAGSSSRPIAATQPYVLHPAPTAASPSLSHGGSWLHPGHGNTSTAPEAEENGDVGAEEDDEEVGEESDDEDEEQQDSDDPGEEENPRGNSQWTMPYIRTHSPRVDSVQLSPMMTRLSLGSTPGGNRSYGTHTTGPYDGAQSYTYPTPYAAQDILHAPQSYPAESSRHQRHTFSAAADTGAQSSADQSKRSVASLPLQIQEQLKSLQRRFIQTDASTNNAEVLDTRYRRVATSHHERFFVPGRVFKMLWSEPAGQINPGKTRNSTHFSTVWLNEQAYSEIRHFVVVRNKGTFSQCIPVQTYKGRGAAKPGLIMADHGIIHTTPTAPNQAPGEQLTKYSIRVEPTKDETLHPASRINYGKAYAVEHNVKVLDIGMVTKNHCYLLSQYFDAAMTGN